ncbi:calcium-binding protein [Selenomonas sp. AB3002]|uniref:calcium-binding protein n=1 Tax=Selenomonas sp. AB3002 TaxID=1392502 RepID=UPI00163A2B9C
MASMEQIASYILRGLNNEWIPQALAKAKSVYGWSFENRGVNFNRISISTANDPNDCRLAYLNGNPYYATLPLSSYIHEDMHLVINTAHLDKIDTSTTSGLTFDRTRALDKDITVAIGKALAYANMHRTDNPNDLESLIADGFGEMLVGADGPTLENASLFLIDQVQHDIFGRPFKGEDAGGYLYMKSLLNYSHLWGKTPQQTLSDAVAFLSNSHTTVNGLLVDDMLKTITNGVVTNQNDVGNFVQDACNTPAGNPNMRDTYRREWHDFLRQTCGINLDDDDTGAITGSDYGGPVQTVESVVPENTSPVSWQALGGNLSKISGLNVYYSNELIQFSQTPIQEGGKLIGNGSTNDVIQAGTGQTSLWGGGASSDVLIGNKSGQAEYFFLSGDGHDTIRNGNWGAGKDKLYLDLNHGFGYSINGNNVDLQLGGDQLTIEGVGSNVVDFTTDNQTTHHVKFGKAGSIITYEDNVDVYLGSSNSTLKVTGNGPQVWANGTQGKVFDGITKLDGSAANNVLLAGNGNVNETIIGGAASSSLWGGQGSSADTLTGGRGSNDYYYGLGDGRDVITAANANDKIMLYNTGLEGIAGIDDHGASMTVTMVDGGTLTLNHVDDNATFVLSNGQSFKHNSKSKGWMPA